MDVSFTIGHKDYTVQSRDGEERLVRRAAALLDEEAQKILEQAGRMPEGRLLLLAGLMLADRHSSMEDRALMAERELARMRSAASGMVASEVQDAMAELAARAEALARQAEGARDAGSADAGAGDAGKEAGREQQV
ncbi:cell division protein ZapA [Paracoccus jeotgali]|uniref:cell division protein ZapA n=1 Tax=Paracoccus jeotgali TaxID=2065379 RepID=UPI0028AA1901|nr:cell division protein ZapA [Paracoccus jeotgali]